MTGLLKLTWQPALAAIIAFVVVTWVNPGTTPGALLLFSAAALASLVLIAALRFAVARILGGPASEADPSGGDNGKSSTDPDA